MSGWSAGISVLCIVSSQSSASFRFLKEDTAPKQQVCLGQNAIRHTPSKVSQLCMKPFVTFLSAVAFFHVSEFVLASIYMRKDLSRRCKSCYVWPNVEPSRCWQRTLSRTALFSLVVVVRSLASQRTLLCRHDAGMLGVLVRDKVLQHFQAQGICIHMVLITAPSPSSISPQKVAQVLCR